MTDLKKYICSPKRDRRHRFQCHEITARRSLARHRGTDSIDTTYLRDYAKFISYRGLGGLRQLVGEIVVERALALTLSRNQTTWTTEVKLRHAVIAGWTGRDRAAVLAHIAELTEIGVKAPKQIPVFYRTSVSRVTTDECIEVLGERSSGEVEFVLLWHAKELWLGVGSDHTDRAVETYDVNVSKQMCEKPIAPMWWSFRDVAGHWDRLILRSYVGDERTLYQEGSVTRVLDPGELIRHYSRGADLPDDAVMFCGTLPAVGGIRPASRFAFELEDPVLERSIRHEYRINTLPVS